MKNWYARNHSYWLGGARRMMCKVLNLLHLIRKSYIEEAELLLSSCHLYELHRHFDWIVGLSTTSSTQTMFSVPRLTLFGSIYRPVGSFWDFGFGDHMNIQVPISIISLFVLCIIWGAAIPCLFMWFVATRELELVTLNWKVQVPYQSVVTQHYRLPSSRLLIDCILGIGLR